MQPRGHFTFGVFFPQTYYPRLIVRKRKTQIEGRSMKYLTSTPDNCQVMRNKDAVATGGHSGDKAHGPVVPWMGPETEKGAGGKLVKSE